jgi:LDH2 family malate/lactate/ureidoglycolate dehydrogenase
VRVYAAPDAADAFARALLAAHDVPDGDAAVVADCLVRADLRGVDTHGLMRLPGYLDRVRRGLVNPNIPREEYRSRMDTLVERVHACPKAEGFDNIMLPGEPEARQERIRRRSGIPYAGSEIDALQEEAKRAGVAQLRVSNHPLDS